MGSPTFFFYPEDGGPLVTVALPTLLADLRDERGAVAHVPVDAVGLPTSILERTTLSVRIAFGPYGHQTYGPLLHRGMQLLQDHLDRGGVAGFSRDSAKAWCGVIPGTPNQGGVTLRTGGNGFTAWGSASLAAGDELVIEEGAPGWRTETVTYSSASGGTLTVAGLGPSSGFAYSYKTAPILVRHRDFFPVLWRKEEDRGTPLMESNRRISWSADFRLEYSRIATLRLFDAGAYRERPRVGASEPHILSGALPLASTSGPLRGAVSLDKVVLPQATWGRR